MASVQVKSPPKLRQVGVFLDMDEHQVSFYNVKSHSEIYSFTGSSEFTERMFPLLGTGDKEVPLVLMTTQQQLGWDTRDRTGGKDEDKMVTTWERGVGREGEGSTAASTDVGGHVGVQKLNLTTEEETDFGLFIRQKPKHREVYCCCHDNTMSPLVCS